jgi:hypothetical protein
MLIIYVPGGRWGGEVRTILFAENLQRTLKISPPETIENDSENPRFEIRSLFKLPGIRYEM